MSPVREHAEADRNKLITTLILWIYINPSIAALEIYAQGRSLLRQRQFIKSAPQEGQAASPPWWWCLLGDLCFLCVFWLVTCLSDASYLRFRGVTKCPTQACTIPKLGQWEWWNNDKDTSIGTSTAYEGCQTPYICLTLKWMYQYMSQEPQTLQRMLWFVAQEHPWFL
jgi:hypothetical protein